MNTVAPQVLKSPGSVQEQPPVSGAGSTWEFIGDTERGPVLPAYGTRRRDRWLRDYYRHEYNTLVQGAISGLIKKVTSAPWEITGDIRIMFDRGDGSFIEKASVTHFQEVLQMAHFGDGWKSFLSRVLLDYLTQDFGAVIEIMGPGDPSLPLTGAVTGLAHLDSGRCYATGNSEYPIAYYSLITNTIHKMHHTRVIRLVDMPDGDERYLGYGMCALSRAIAIVHREILMGRYIEQKLDDMPAPGIISVSGTTEQKNLEAWRKYTMQQEQDIKPAWGRTFWMYAIDPALPVKVEPTSFAVAPDKFNWVDYTNLHVNALALALGMDKQELWELTGGGIGTGAQSQILHAKSQGKAFGDILMMVERALNMDVLPEEMEFSFRHRDTQREQAEAEMNKRYIEIAQAMNSMQGVFRPNEIRKMLANSSEMFQEILTDAQGRVELPDVDRLTPQQIAATDTQPTPADPLLAPSAPTLLGSGDGPSGYDPRPADRDGIYNEGKKQFSTFAFASLSRGIKNYDAVRSEFVANLTDLIGAGLNDDVSRRRFGTVMRAQLRRLGQKAYEAGLQKGGVNEPLDDDDLMAVQAWVQDQSSYVTRFANEVYQKGLTDAEMRMRANIWANKSLQQMYYGGLGSADKNGMYAFVGDDGNESCETCQRLKGQVHRFRDWRKKRLIPRVDTANYVCGGFNCNHTLVRTIDRAQGKF